MYIKRFPTLFVCTHWRVHCKALEGSWILHVAFQVLPVVSITLICKSLNGLLAQRSHGPGDSVVIGIREREKESSWEKLFDHKQCMEIMGSAVCVNGIDGWQVVIEEVQIEALGWSGFSCFRKTASVTYFQWMWWARRPSGHELVSFLIISSDVFSMHKSIYKIYSLLGDLIMKRNPSS